MLDVDQRGEPPLKRGLSALKHTRSLRDPSTVSIWESPVLDPSSDIGGRSQFAGFTAKVTEAHCVTRRETACTGENARMHSRRYASSKTPSWSTLCSESGEQKSWGRGRNGTVVAEDRTGELHMEEVFENQEIEHRLISNLCGERVLLQDWTSPNFAEDVDETESARDQEWVQWKNNSAGVYARAGTVLAHYKDAFDLENQAKSRNCRLIDQSGKARFRTKILRKTLSQRGVPTLSPFVLNSLDNMQYHGHSPSLFTLEAPYFEQHEFQNRGTKNGLDGNGSANSVRSQSPLPLKHLARSGARDTAKGSQRSQHTLASSTTTSQRSVSAVSTPGGAWETSSLQLNCELEVSELSRNGCGIPCYWSKSQKRGKSLLDIAGRSLSCGFSDTSRRKSVHPRSKFRSGSHKDSAGCTSDGAPPPSDLEEMEAIPLLTEPSAASDDIGFSSADDSERLSNDLYGELGLECRAAGSQKSMLSKARLDISKDIPLSEGKELAIFVDRPRSLSQKYRPKVFEELVGQNLVTYALLNAVLKKKIAPVYLFQGSRGTGKTSAARIFAAALNCVSSEERRPCRVCCECVALASGKRSDILEVDAASNNGIERVKALLQSALSASSVSRFKVFIVDECHMLTNETWNALLKILEEPPGNVVFVLITTDPDKLPRTAVSRCQRFPFAKIKDSDIVSRLQAIAKLEKLDVEPGALDLVASRADGSLRDAEIILDQLSLLGQKITVSTMHELVGSVSNEKLFSLLDTALCSDTVSTVRRARELVDSGVDPLDLMSQLATLIADLLSGNSEQMCRVQGGFFSRQALLEEEMERLRIALKILSEADKQLRAASNDRTTWLTAALLQFGPNRPLNMFPASSAGSSSAASPMTLASSSDWQALESEKETSKKSSCKGTGSDFQKRIQASSVNNKSRTITSSFEARIHPTNQSSAHDVASRVSSNESMSADSSGSEDKNDSNINFLSPGNLGSIWCNVLEVCKSIPLRQLLHRHGKLLSLSFSPGEAVVHLEFRNPEYKSRAERSRKSITKAFQMVLGLIVEVNISLASLPPGAEGPDSKAWPVLDQTDLTQEGFKQPAIISRVNCRFQNKDCGVENTSLHARRSQGGAVIQTTVEQATSPHCFPEILNLHNAGAAVSLPTPRSSSNASVLVGSIQPGQKAENSLPEEGRTENVMVLGASGCSPLQVCDRTELHVFSELQNSARMQKVVVEYTTDCTKPTAGQDNRGCTVFSNFESDRLQADDLEEENLSLESQSWLKYGGLLCWKAPETGQEKVRKQCRRRKHGILIRLVPCAKAKSQ